MFVTVNETLTALMERFVPIHEGHIGTWKTRCRAATKFAGQTYAAGCRVGTTRLGNNADVALLVSNTNNWALVLRVYSGEDFLTEIDGKPAALPKMDPVSVFRSTEDECRDLLLAIASAYASESDDGFGGAPDLDANDGTDDGF